MNRYYKVQKLKHDQSPVNDKGIPITTSQGLALNANANATTLVQDFPQEMPFDENGFFDVPIQPVEKGALIGYENFCFSPVVIDTRSDDTKFTNQVVDKKKSNINHSYAPIDVNNTCVNSAHGGGIENPTSTTWKNISWGTYEEAMEALMSKSSSYELVYGQGSPPKPQMMPRKKDMKKPITNAIQKVKDNKLKKYARRESLQGFPNNVRTLTMTGIFDEVLVRYGTTSGEQLLAAISGPGYYCGCYSCNFTKLVNADEFERHAGCKTSHPNHNIRFMNGKSIHQVVQELKVTPREKLFNAILMVTGSSVNEKAFKAWKESFQGGHISKQQLDRS